MDKVFLCRKEILSPRRGAVVTQVDVLAPVELQDPVVGPLVVGVGHGARGLIAAGRGEVEDDEDEEERKQGADHDKKYGHQFQIEPRAVSVGPE